ncbi:MAG: ribonuclease III [Nitrospirota bacterium]
MEPSSSKNTNSKSVSVQEDLSLLETRIRFVFKNKDLLRQALTHKSYSNENPTANQSNNERLEFLGDAVLGFVISQSLFVENSFLSEGDLSKCRAGAVKESSLAKIAKGMDLGDYLFLGVGEERGGGREKPTLLGDTLEAVIAAVYLDGGIRAAKRFILREFPYLSLVKLLEGSPSTFFDLEDYKTELQEICQQRFFALPEYHTINELGPGHQKHFEVEVQICGKVYGTGSGKSKKEAERQSAKAALTQLMTPCVEEN